MWGERKILNTYLMEQDYSNREIDFMMRGTEEKFDQVHKKLDKILDQTTLSNSRIGKLEKVMLVFSTAVIILLISNGSKFVDFVKGII